MSCVQIEFNLVVILYDVIKDFKPFEYENSHLLREYIKSLTKTYILNPISLEILQMLTNLSCGVG